LGVLNLVTTLRVVMPPGRSASRVDTGGRSCFPSAESWWFRFLDAERVWATLPRGAW